MNRNYFKLFENCRIVKGANRAVICDLQRNKFVFVPLSLANLFDENNLLDIQFIKSEIKEESLSIFDEYIFLLKKNEFIFPCAEQEINLFPKLNLEFDYPALISNLIVDYNQNSKHDLDEIYSSLIALNCRHIQFRFFDEVDFDTIIHIVKRVNSSFVQSVEFFVKNSKNISHNQLIQWVKENKKISSVILHSSLENKILNEAEYGFGVVIKVKQKINSEIHCGSIHHNYFNTMLESFTESVHHNSCLNRKISIDANGDIKNCPSMPESYGNIKDTTLEEALHKPGFKKYWNITKDQIEVCKDCEFRHVCTDCRAYTERTKFEKDIDLSKPLKCGYNPYTNEWAEWSTNPLKEKAIEYYGMEDLINRKKQ